MAALSLAFDILARDQGATRTLNNVGDSAERAGKKGTAFGRAMKSGMGLAVGAIAGLALGSAFKTFIDEANEAAKVGRLTNAVVTSTGGAAKISAEGVADLAEALSVKAGIDDEVIQSGANVLLTFTNIRNEAGKGNAVFDQATAAALNMSVALGKDLQGSITMVGKALNDPIKGTTALGKAGIQFTADQKEQIKVLTESGDILGAQKIILGELETQFGGAAEAGASALDKMKVAGGNLGEAVGGLLLPGVTKLAEYMTTNVIPAVQSFVEGFQNGEGAGGRLAATLTTVKDVAVGLFNILFKGDFTGGFSAFGIEEDSELIGYLFSFRDAVIEVGRYLRDLYVDGKAAADVLITGLKPVWDELTVAWNDSLKPALMELFTALRDEVGPIFGVTSDESKPLLVQLASMAVTILTAVVPAIVGGIAAFSKFISAVSKVVGPLVDATVKSALFAAELARVTIRVQMFVVESVGRVRALGAAFRLEFQSVQNNVGAAITGITGMVGSLPGRVMSAVGNLGALLRQKGRDLIQGLISGILDKLGGIRSAMSNVAQTIGNFLPGSPVKEGPLVKWNDGNAGRRLVDMGIIQPLNASVGGVASAMTNVTGAVAMPGGPIGRAASGRPIIITLDGRVIAESTSSYQADAYVSDIL